MISFEVMQFRAQKRRAGARLVGTTVRCLRTANTWSYAKMSLYSSVRVRKACAYEQRGMI